MASRGLSVEGLRALIGVFTVLAVGLTAGRFYIHRNKTNTLSRWADYLNGAAALLLIAFVSTQAYYLGLYYAIQLWAADLGPRVSHNDLVTYYHVEFALFILFWVIIYLVKFSFLMLYRALFAISKPFRAAWWGVFTFTFMAFLVDIFACLWVCGHPWDLFNTVKCATEYAGITSQNMIIVGSVFNIVSDIACMALPLCMLRSLKVNRAQKVALAGVFLVALVVVMCDIMRAVATFTFTINTAFNVLEPIIAVLVCALPVYRSLLGGAFGGGASKWWRSWFSSIRSGGSSRSAGLNAEKARFAAGSPSSTSSWTAGSGSSAPPSREGARSAPPQPLGKMPKQIVVQTDLESQHVDSPLNYGIHYDVKASGPRMDV